MTEQMISVAKNFQTSINIAYDLFDEDKITNFIPTKSAISVIDEVLHSTSPNATQRARILIGAYGRGKSHIILVLLSILMKQNIILFNSIIKRIEDYNSDTASFIQKYLYDKTKLLPIIVSGNNTSLTQSFLGALQLSLKMHKLENLMPETHFQSALNTISNWKTNYKKTYDEFIQRLDRSIDSFLIALNEYDIEALTLFEKLYPELTAGSVFNPFVGFNVVDIYEATVSKLIENGYAGVFVVYDEFSKYLESNIENTSINDIKLLQDFAEKCNRSGTKQMHLMLISHKDISNYIDEKLPKEKVDGWRGVSGRFKHMSLHNNFSQMYEIISAVIKKDADYWKLFLDNNSSKFEELKTRFIKNEIIDTNESNIAIAGCYPLHPVSTFILPRLSEKIAQNERTLFTFLSAEQKYTLYSFLQEGTDKFSLLTPDYLYDYFEPLLRKELWNTEIHQQYSLTEKLLQKVKDTSLEAKIIKTISLVYCIEQFERLPPTYDKIVSIFYDTVTDIKEIDTALTSLIEKECIVYLKRSNNYLKLKESSGVDIPSEIKKTVDKYANSIDVATILNNSLIDNYVYPVGYNDENDVIRYFNISFINSKSFFIVDDWDKVSVQNDADGSCFAIIPEKKTDIDQMIEYLDVIGSHNIRTVFIIPQKYSDIKDTAMEYHAVQQLKKLVVDDELLSDEYDIYMEDLGEVIQNFISAYIRPDIGNALYYYRGTKQNITRKAQISVLLSKICRGLYPHMPIINNESINKNILSTTAINSRTKLISGILENNTKQNLGLTGTGQDVSFMRSTLIKTGILTDYDDNPVFNLAPSDKNLRFTLEKIQEFIGGYKRVGEQNFAELYNTLIFAKCRTGVGIGLKRGVIPVYLAVVLHQYKSNVIIKDSGSEVKINADTLNAINESPARFSLIQIEWTQEKAEYIDALEKLFRDYIIEGERNYNNFSYLVYAINRWFIALPKYVKEMSMQYTGVDNPGVPLPKEVKQFINSLKMVDKNTYGYLFEKIPSCFGLQEISVIVVEKIIGVKSFCDNAVSGLIKSLTSDVKSLFSDGENQEASFSSIITDWVDKVDSVSKGYVFPNNDNSVLELMRTVTNDESIFIQRLGKSMTALRIEDWKDNTITVFFDGLKLFIKQIKSFSTKKKSAEQALSNTYKLSFVANDGTETSRTFPKVEYSKKAKLLLNEITTNMEEYGQALSAQEKRQILIDLLEKLC